MNLAEFFKHDFNKGSFKLYDKNGNVIFYESLYRCWIRYELDENGEITFWEVSDGDTFGTLKNKVAKTDPNSIAQFFNHDFSKGSFRLYSKKGNEIFVEASNGYWQRCELDENEDVTFWEDSDGDIWETPKNKLN